MAIKKRGGRKKEKADGSPFAGAIKFHGVFSIHGFTVIQALGASFLWQWFQRGLGGQCRRSRGWACPGLTDHRLPLGLEWEIKRSCVGETPGRLPKGSFAGAGQSPRSRRLGEDTWPELCLTKKPLRPPPSPPGGCFCAAPDQVPASERDLSMVQLKTMSGVDFGFLSFEASSQI